MKALRILVAEDDAVVAMLLADFLVQIGHSVCAIEATEAGAVAAASRAAPDLMILDARLASGSGVSAVAEILRSGFIPHIFVTGDMLSSQAISADAVVLQKPYFDVDLLRAIPLALAVSPPPSSSSFPGANDDETPPEEPDGTAAFQRH